MKLTTFNPVTQAVKDQAGFEGMAARRFRKALCWQCQKDKPRFSGVTSMTQAGDAASARAAGAPVKFICAECTEQNAIRKAEKAARLAA